MRIRSKAGAHTTHDRTTNNNSPLRKLADRRIADAADIVEGGGSAQHDQRHLVLRQRAFVFCVVVFFRRRGG